MTSMKFDPHEPGTRRNSFAKDGVHEDFFSALNQALFRAELPTLPVDDSVRAMPLIYIVGAPRSGTTLLSQLISRHLPVGYISNLVARFWLRPSVGIRLSAALFADDERRKISLRSTHGTTDGVSNPHEFGYFWRHWLKLDAAPTHHLSNKMLAAVDAVGLKNALENEILAAFHRPVLFKNVICGFHAEFLTHLHPASLFVYIARDAEAAVASILKVRQERFGSYKTWWSLMPSTYPFSPTPRDPVEEVVRQVFDCRHEMESELNKPGVSSLFVSYEALCRDPRGVLDQIVQQLQHLGYNVDPDYVGLSSLPISSVSKLPPDLSTRLHKYIRTATKEKQP